jgi:hypothetical protein
MDDDGGYVSDEPLGADVVVVSPLSDAGYASDASAPGVAEPSAPEVRLIGTFLEVSGCFRACKQHAVCH